jgi:predicted ATPase/DNA-binding CsgD family transcriptional regulator
LCACSLNQVTSLIHKTKPGSERPLPPDNLPLQITSLVGREHEVAAVCELLRQDDVRLLTLIGPPGIGKTRLAIRAAAELLPDFADGVNFVNLAPVTDPALVSSTVAQTLGVKETQGCSLLQSLQTHLQNKRMLLLLDNFEQVIEAAPVLAGMLSASPHLKLLVTSREVLHLSGEHNFPVPPLSIPPVLAPQDLLGRLAPLPMLQLAEYEAVQLFIQRATALKPDFALGEDNAYAIAEICRKLDGLPLAIELAAARIRYLSPHAILERLKDRFRLLMGGPRDLPARHQALQATIEWSYDLLNEHERKLFRRLAVFRGEYTLQAIEAVCNTEEDTGVEVLDTVASLVDKSLLGPRLAGGQRSVPVEAGEARFVMLETIHEFAREKLQESGEAEAVQRRHALYFLALAERAEPKLHGPEQVAWLDHLEAELDNFRAALEWAYYNDIDIKLGLRIASALSTFWNRRGHVSEGQEWLSRLLSKAREAGVDRSEEGALSMAGTLYALGFLVAMRRGDFMSARPLVEESIKLYKQLQAGKRTKGLSESLNLLGIVVSRFEGMAARRRLHEEALQIARETGDIWSIARSLYQLGHVARLSGDYALAHSMFEESLLLFQESGDKFNIGLALIGMGQIAEYRGDYQTARRLYEESLAIYRELGDKWGIVGALISLSSAALHQKDYSAARSFSEESVAAAKQLGGPGIVADALQGLGRAVYLSGDHARAYSLYRESLTLYALHKELGDKYEGALCLMDLAGLLVVAMSTGKAAIGRSSSTGQGKAEDLKEPVTKAVQALGAARALLDNIGVRLDPMSQKLFNTYIASARAQLGERRFASALAAGRTMEPDQAVAWALSTTLPQQVDVNEQSPQSPRAVKLALGGLTRRERQVATLIAQGKSNREIADELVVSERTVEGHVSNIFSKLGFHSRTQVSAWAVEKGLTKSPNS